MDSTFGPPLIDGLSDIEQFRRIVRDGQRNGSSVMKGFADDPNVAPYLADISAYLQARTDGALGRESASQTRTVRLLWVNSTSPATSVQCRR
jgi:hypothetical protein